jgi:hypothetical protein
MHPWIAAATVIDRFPQGLTRLPTGVPPAP